MDGNKYFPVAAPEERELESPYLQRKSGNLLTIPRSLTNENLVIYLIGALKNREIPVIGKLLREDGFEVFDDWHEAGPDADSYWQAGEIYRGRSYREALQGHHANCVFEFDRYHLDRSDMGILVLPAGKSGHLELGYLRGQGKPTFVLFDKEPERYDVMYKFCNEIFFNLTEMRSYLSVVYSTPLKVHYG